MKVAESFITTMEPKNKTTVQVKINSTQFPPWAKMYTEQLNTAYSGSFALVISGGFP